MQIKDQNFSLTLPPGEWTNHTTNESFDYHLGEQEQVMVVAHLPRKRLADHELFTTVVDLLRRRLAALQQHSGGTCQFDAPTFDKPPGKMCLVSSGRDARQGVLFHIGVFGAPQRIVAVSYYDYSRPESSDRFKSRASALFSTVSVI
jgi:hypothetical protein